MYCANWLRCGKQLIVFFGNENKICLGLILFQMFIHQTAGTEVHIASAAFCIPSSMVLSRPFHWGTLKHLGLSQFKLILSRHHIPPIYPYLGTAIWIFSPLHIDCRRRTASSRNGSQGIIDWTSWGPSAPQTSLAAYLIIMFLHALMGLLGLPMTLSCPKRIRTARSSFAVWQHHRGRHLQTRKRFRQHRPHGQAAAEMSGRISQISWGKTWRILKEVRKIWNNFARFYCPR